VRRYGHVEFLKIGLVPLHLSHRERSARSAG
jgi:hypothetical protein